jgi:hypothetical protein
MWLSEIVKLSNEMQVLMPMVSLLTSTAVVVLFVCLMADLAAPLTDFIHGRRHKGLT